MRKTISLLLSLVILCTLCPCTIYASEATDILLVEQVDLIEMETETAAVRYTGYRYVPENFFALNAANKEKTIFLQFEYTNKTDVPTNFQTDFKLTVEQKSESLDMLRAWSSKATKEDSDAFANFYANTATTETIPVYYPVIMKDYSPITITVSATKNGQSVTQIMEQTIVSPDGVIVPGEAAVSPLELVGSWINPTTGDTLEISEGNTDKYTGVVKGFADFTPANRLLWTWNPAGWYEVEGDIFTLLEKHYQISKQNDKLYLSGMDTDATFMLRKDFYKFEDIEIHGLGDTVQTDAIQFTLTGFAYDDLIDMDDLDGFWPDIQQGPFKPDNGMVWAKVTYILLNVSDRTISLHTTETNVRFFIVYREKFTFDMETLGYNYLTKGHGNMRHIEWFGSFFNPLEIAPLVFEVYDTWFPVSPVVKYDQESSHILLVLLPTETGTTLAAYDLSTAISAGQAQEEAN